MSWVVFGYTPDEYGAAALEHAIHEAAHRGWGVVAVNATKGDALVDDRFASPEAMSGLEDALTASGLEHQVRQSVGGDVAEQVLRVADEVGARLLVVGIRRRSPVGKLLMGSVAQRLLLDAHCPVLAVKPGDPPGA